MSSTVALLARTRLLVFTQSDNAIPMPFFIVLVFWLTVISAASARSRSRAVSTSAIPSRG